jgi:hypothetical protein
MTKAERNHARRLRKENMPDELEEYIHQMRCGDTKPPEDRLVEKNVGEIIRNLKEQRDNIPLWVSMRTPKSLLGKGQGRIEFGRSGGYLPTGKFVDGTRKTFFKLAASGPEGGYYCGYSDKKRLIKLNETYNQMAGHESSVRLFSTAEGALTEERMLRMQSLPKPYYVIEVECWGGFSEISTDGSFIFSCYSPVYARGAKLRLDDDRGVSTSLKWQKAARATRRVPLLASTITRSYAQEMEFKLQEKRSRDAKKQDDDVLAYTKRRWNRFQNDKMLIKDPKASDPKE